MVRNKPRAAGPSSSEPRSTGFHVSAAAAASCCVVAFSLGWGVRDTYPDLFGWGSLALAAWRRTAATHPDTAAGGVGAPYGYNPWEFTTHPTMASDGFNWTQLSMGRVNNFRKGEDGEPAVMQMGAHEVEQMGAFALFQKTYSRAIPAKITGLANQWSERISQCRLRDFREHWGEKTVQASFSPDKLFQRGHYVDDAVGRQVSRPVFSHLAHPGPHDPRAHDPRAHVSHTCQTCQAVSTAPSVGPSKCHRAIRCLLATSSTTTPPSRARASTWR